MTGGLMVCGTTSDAGKSMLVTALCRLLARRGVTVAPFKAQNMSLNSYITPEGHEIGRAQGVQALAAGIEPDVAMNPILLKPTSDTGSQVVLNGRPVADMTARQYHEHQPRLLDAVLSSLADLRERFDVVVAEGAGSPAEINLLAHDIVNLRVAHEAQLPAVVVGDIQRGGVFAALYGTVALLPEEYRRLVRGFVINKFRGDPSLLGDGPDRLEELSGVPTLGVLPYVEGIGLDAEDSLALATWPDDSAEGTPAGVTPVDVAVVRLPHLANFTDFDPLALESAVHVRLARHPADVGGADLVVIPGTKATVADLDWLVRRGFPEAIEGARQRGTTVLGICGGYQMLGRVIHDEVESRAGTVPGIGWLDVVTEFNREKLTRRRAGTALDRAVTGYQIQHGRAAPGPSAGAWITLDGGPGEGGPEGASSRDGLVVGTSLHGLFEEDGFREAFLARVARRRGKAFSTTSVSFAAARRARFDRLADLVEEHLDVERLLEIIHGAGHVGRDSGGTRGSPTAPAPARNLAP